MTLDKLTETTKGIYFSFSPTNKQINEIEKWLIAEWKKTRNGFYCNWDSIKYSFEQNRIVTISFNNKIIGFVTWRLTTDKTARIEIAEIKPTHRKKGIGKLLVNEVINFLKEKKIQVIDLQCSPETSELVWKALGFIEFPDPPKNYNFRTDSNKMLFNILINHAETNSALIGSETIELWNEEPYMTDENTFPTYIWNIKFMKETRKLLTPIIHPGHYEWRIRWKINGVTIKDDKVKRFGAEINYGSFIIIEELPL